MWVLFHTLMYLFLLPVILASVYLNSLKHIKSQLRKITPGNQTRGKHTPEKQRLFQVRFQNSELPIKDGEYAVGRRY